MELKGRTAIITGASSGIGEAISFRLAEEGVNVALFARSRDKLQAVENKINKSGGRALAFVTDVTDEANVRASVDGVKRELESPDILISNAGLGIFNRVEEMDFSAWKQQLDVMLNGLFLMCRFVLPCMYKRKKGDIVAISSLWAKKGCATCTGYTAAKFGVRGFLESLREEAREYGVRVTNVMPGTVDTPFFEKSGYSEGRSLSGALKAEDVAETVVYALKLRGGAVAEEVVLQSLAPPY